MAFVRRALAGLLVAVGLPATATFASDLIPAAPSQKSWTVELGAEMRVLPRYQGSEVYGFYPVPFLDVRPAGTPPRFHAPRDGFGFAILDVGSFNAGPVVQVELGRHVKHNPALQGLGNVGITAEVGGFAEYWPAQWLRARIEVRQGTGAHHGIVSDQTVDFVVPVTSQWTLSGGPRMTVVTKDANTPYFSVNPTQSAASGLPVFDAGGGIRSVGVGAQGRYQWDARWATYVFLEYTRLTGDVANSPIVAQRGSPDQAMFGVGATYSFDVPALW
jgi:MipA family protein